jgi:penicillin amidase
MKPWRILVFLLVMMITTSLAYILNTRFDKIPALGKFFSPQHGFWQQAEPYHYDYNQSLKLPGLKGEVNVYFDERLVPHIYADNQEDAVFVQGYLHAKFRLWQMEFQTHAAAGRISEIVGDVAMNYDRQQRRMGMVYAAENMLKEMEADPLTQSLCNAYTAGVNSYIDQLSEADLPIEYKLLGYQPERWSNLKIALFVKAMSKDLSAKTDDLENTMALSVFSDEQIKFLFPDIEKALDPIVPKGTVFAPATVIPVKPANADSLYLRKYDTALSLLKDKPHPDNGSNNWAVSGSKTKSGAPLLCNDPHLKINLPSVWFEMQMSGPNSERDVMDFYEIRFRDNTRKEYWFNNEWKKAERRVEQIGIKGGQIFYDTVAYTVFGPVIFDESFKGEKSNGKSIAVRWKAHDPSNEAKCFWLINHARNYDEFENAIKYFQCPGQNFVFASRSGDIAIRQQGSFPAKWDRQGLYVMPGTDSSYMWQGTIPQQDNPHQYNPERGFVASGNQRPVDSAYPYYIPGGYYLYRGITINRLLSGMTNADVGSMMRLQNENYNPLAAAALPHLLRAMEKTAVDGEARAYLDSLKNWNLKNDANTIAPTLFTHWYDSLEAAVWDDEIGSLKEKGFYPVASTLIEAYEKDSAFKYIDNIHTPNKETWEDVVAHSFRKILPGIDSLKQKNTLSWADYKNTTLYHLLGKTMMPFAKPHLPIGGGKHIINAAQHDHGSSWKMIVDLSGDISAYVVYPGGQNGNPGSRYYDQFAQTWANGRYYKAWVYKKGMENDAKVKWTMRFN